MAMADKWKAMGARLGLLFLAVRCRFSVCVAHLCWVSISKDRDRKSERVTISDHRMGEIEVEEGECFKEPFGFL